MARWEHSFPEPNEYGEEGPFHRIHDEYPPDEPVQYCECGERARITNPDLGAFCSWTCHNRAEEQAIRKRDTTT